MTVPLPNGFGLTLDASAKQMRDGLWFGGSPPRVLRLTPAGRRAWASLQGGAVSSRSTGLLARRLTDAGLAHPVPPRTAPPSPPPEVTVIVPAHDRPDDLARCLAALGTDHPVLVVDDASQDPASIARVAAAFDARLLRREVNGGPGAARNTGLAEAGTPVVALVDSDCEPAPGWIEALLPHLRDPQVAAVAPRITGRAGATWSGRYTRANGSLDLGAAAARVAPGSRVAYVPTAALLVRRSALLDTAVRGAVFDEALRVGEDVDLVWRLHEGGWRVRYDPAVTVRHREPVGWPALLHRRFRYGTSAAGLSRRHPGATPPMVVHPWPALAVAGLLARSPLVAALGYGGAVATTARTLRRADVPTDGVLAAMASAVQQTWLGAGRYAVRFAAPLLAAAVLVPGDRTRRVAAASLLLGPPLSAWWPRRAALGPARFVAANLADDIAYGSGVWAGCLQARTAEPLRPVLTRRSVRIDPLRS